MTNISFFGREHFPLEDSSKILPTLPFQNVQRFLTGTIQNTTLDHIQCTFQQHTLRVSAHIHEISDMMENKPKKSFGVD